MTRIDELTAQLLDGTLTPTEGEELERLLAADPAATRAYLDLLELEAALRGLRTGFDLSEPTLARLREAQAERIAQGVLATIAARQPPPWQVRSRPAEMVRPTHRVRRRQLLLGSLTAIAAALLVGLWLGRGAPPGGFLPGDPAENLANDDATARLTRAVGAVELLTPEGEVRAAQPGQEVPAGHILRTVGDDSLARVELPDRTLLDIEPDTVVRFEAPAAPASQPPRLFLAAGQLTAAVPEQTAVRPLVVGTGVADVVARGGVFVVASASPESARIDIRRGNVEVRRRDQPRPLPMDGGSAYLQSGLAKVWLDPAYPVAHTPARSLPCPGAREAVFAPDGREVWVASGRHLIRWTRDGGTAEYPLSPRRPDGPAGFSPDRSVLLAQSGHKDDRLGLWSLPGGEPLRTLDLRLPEPRYRAVAPAAAWIAWVDPAANRKRVVVSDGRTGTERHRHEFDEPVACLAVAPDGCTLVVGVADSGRGMPPAILLLDATTGRRLGTLPIQKKGLSALAFSPDGRLLAAGFNGLVQVWDVPHRELIRAISGFERVVTCLAISPDGRLLAAGTRDGQVWMWTLPEGRIVQRLEPGGRGVRSVAFAPDSRRLVTVVNQAPVAIWAVADEPADVH